jgi:hypothetical protein
MSVYELTAREIYATYVPVTTRPEELFDQGRNAIATRLILEEGLRQEDAYYAADQILFVAQEMIETGQS